MKIHGEQLKFLEELGHREVLEQLVESEKNLKQRKFSEI